MKIVYKATTPAPDTPLRYYTCDHCGKEFRYDPETCANQLILPDWKNLKIDSHDEYKFWCRECVVLLKINPT